MYAVVICLHTVWDCQYGGRRARIRVIFVSSLEWYQFRECFKQSKYPIIYDLPEAFVGKLRKLLDCEDVRHTMRAVVTDEAYLVVEWQVFNICLELFPCTTV